MRSTGRIVIVTGVPGVGKTTVITKCAEMLEKRGLKVKVENFGTVMLNLALKRGIVKHRDDIRKLPLEAQIELQKSAAQILAQSGDEDILVVDTHQLIVTKGGFWPGLPFHVVSILIPTQLFLIEASPKEILSRRIRDADRKRDLPSIESVEKEMLISRMLAAACAFATGATVALIENREGAADKAAEEMTARILGWEGRE